MIQIDLTEEETEILREILESDISDLRMEVANTDSMEYRERLKMKKSVLLKVVSRIAELKH